MRVRGIWRDYARQQGSIVLDLHAYQVASGDRGLNEWAIWWRSGRDVGVSGLPTLKQWMLAHGAQAQDLELSEPAHIRAQTLAIFDRSFAITIWLQGIAIAIGLFGTSASLAAEVLARRKEFGLLQHLGLTSKQITGLVSLEALGFACVGSAWGLCMGLAISVILIKVVNPQSFHWSMDWQAPWGALGLLCLGVVSASSVVAGLSTAWSMGADLVRSVKEDW